MLHITIDKYIKDEYKDYSVFIDTISFIDTVTFYLRELIDDNAVSYDRYVIKQWEDGKNIRQHTLRKN